MEAKNRIYIWDNLKLVLMLFVVVFHCLVPYTRESHSSWMTILWTLIMTITMPLFFTISGYWFKDRPWSYAFKNYLWPCVLFSILLYAYGYWFYPPYKSGLSKGVTGYAMWFLLTLFVYQIITPYVLKIRGSTDADKKALSKLIVCSILFALVAGLETNVTSYFQISRTICHYPFFLFGILLKHYDLDIIRCEYKKTAYIVLIAGFALYLFLNLTTGLLGQTSFYAGFGLSLVNLLYRILTFLLDFLLIPSVIILTPNRVLFGGVTMYGAKTMNVYLLHMFIVFPICYRLAHPIMFEPLGYILNFVVVPLLCMLFYNKYIDRLIRIFLIR